MVARATRDISGHCREYPRGRNDVLHGRQEGFSNPAGGGRYPFYYPRHICTIPRVVDLLLAVRPTAPADRCNEIALARSAAFVMIDNHHCAKKCVARSVNEDYISTRVLRKIDGVEERSWACLISPSSAARRCDGSGRPASSLEMEI